MPLIAQAFADALDTFANPTAPGFVAGPTNAVDAAIKHAAAFREFMTGLVTVPPVLMTTHLLAESVMAATLAGQALPPPAGIAAVNAGYTAYAATVIAALAASGYAVVTPPTPPGPITTPPPPGLGSLAYAAIVFAWLVRITGSVPPLPAAPWA